MKQDKKDKLKIILYTAEALGGYGVSIIISLHLAHEDQALHFDISCQKLLARNNWKSTTVIADEPSPSNCELDANSWRSEDVEIQASYGTESRLWSIAWRQILDPKGKLLCFLCHLTITKTPDPFARLKEGTNECYVWRKGHAGPVIHPAFHLSNAYSPTNI